MATNMYRVGDYVYFETSSTLPYQIRRIEELNKTPSGNVEAKVMCFFRRRDIPSSLVMLADKHQSPLEDDDSDVEQNSTSSNGCYSVPSSCITATSENLTHLEKHQLKHRELFLSRQIETLSATHIRGKCTVTLLNETESLSSYLLKDDTFFYSLVYDPQQKTLLADKGEIRVGSRYQADITPLLRDGEKDMRNLEDLESLVWTPEHGLTDRQIDQFLVISRSVGTFARALDCSSSIKQPSLHMSAAAASRDVTLFHAMDTLHKNMYNLSYAASSLVPSSGPVLCRDEMEEWSASEANLFEEALEKYGKDFNDIRQDFLPWKTLKNIIEYYYMWKTTDRYVQQKRVKAVEAESKLKQVFIPNYNKHNPAALTNGKTLVNGNSNEVTVGKACESCQATNSSQWYAWGPSTHEQCRLCSDCWQYWKKFGGLKIATQLAKEEERLHSTIGRIQRCTVVGCGKEYKARSQLVRHAAQAHGITLRPGSPRPVMKSRNSFCLHTSIAYRTIRRICKFIVLPRKASRNPTWPIYAANLKQEYPQHMGGHSFEEWVYFVKRRTGKRKGKVADVSARLGQKDLSCPAWLVTTQKHQLPKQSHIAFPKPPKGPDGSLIYVPVPNKEVTSSASSATPILNSSSQSLLKRKIYEDTNGVESRRVSSAPPTKRAREAPQSLTADATTPTAFSLSQLGVTPPPGLTVTPVNVGVNGGPGIVSPVTSSPPPGPAMLHLSQVGPASAAAPVSLTPSAVSGKEPSQVVQHHASGGRAKIATFSRVGGRPRILAWMDPSDDVYFFASSTTKRLRNSLKVVELKRAARRPWRKIRSPLFSPVAPTPPS